MNPLQSQTGLSPAWILAAVIRAADFSRPYACPVLAARRVKVKGEGDRCRTGGEGRVAPSWLRVATAAHGEEERIGEVNECDAASSTAVDEERGVECVSEMTEMRVQRERRGETYECGAASSAAAGGEKTVECEMDVTVVKVKDERGGEVNECDAVGGAA